MNLKQEIGVLLPFPDSNDTSYLVTCRLQKFSTNTPPLDTTIYNLVSRWRRGVQSLSSDYYCDSVTVMIMFPYSESFNTPPGIEGRISTLLTHWGEKLGMESSNFKDVAICKRGNIQKGLLSMMLADIIEYQRLLCGVIRLTFALRNTETGVEYPLSCMKPIEIIRDTVMSLKDTYCGLPITIWSVCSHCGERMIPWNGEYPPSCSKLVECNSCNLLVQPPNFLDWPR